MASQLSESNPGLSTQRLPLRLKSNKYCSILLQHHVSFQLFAAAAFVHTSLHVRIHFCFASWGGTRSHGEHLSLQGASHEDEAFQDQRASLDDTRSWKVFTRSARTRVSGHA